MSKYPQMEGPPTVMALLGALRAAREREEALWGLLDEASCWLHDWLYTGRGAPIEVGPWLRRYDKLERLT